MSQFQPTKIQAAAQIQALPFAVVKGRKGSPFALMFTGAWTFNPAAGAWRPKMITPSLQVGLNGDGDDKNKLGANLTDKAAKSAAVRVFKAGDRRLGRFAEFLTRYPVKLRNGRIGAHYALANETYHADALGRIYRKVGAEWLADLFAHVVKVGLVAPPSIADRDVAVKRVSAGIAKITKRLERPGSAAVDELEIRRAELVKLRAAMIAAFAEQFPNAGEAPADLEPVAFGDSAGQDFPDGDDDDN